MHHGPAASGGIRPNDGDGGSGGFGTGEPPAAAHLLVVVVMRVPILIAATAVAYMATSAVYS